ncbi:MAG: hypothetical protein Q9195_006491 [Heterodermia aff. obscurata]
MSQTNQTSPPEPPELPSRLPAIVLVHGGFSHPGVYSAFLSALSQAGFVARCPHLPTSFDNPSRKGSLEDDIAAVRKEITELAQDGRSIIVLAHSWGGFVTAEAVSPELYHPAASTSNSKGGIVHLIYLSALMLEPGFSAMDQYARASGPDPIQLDFNEDGTASVANVAELFYNDVDSSEERHRLAAKHVRHNFAEIAREATGTPWKDLPMTYVYCERDMAFPLAAQTKLVETTMKAVPAKRFVEMRLDCGHFPFCSMPDEVVRIVRKVSNAA